MMNQRLNKLIFPVLSVIFLPSCLNFGGGLEFSYNFPSVGEGSAPSDSEYFYIDLDTDKYKSSGDLIPYYEISTTTEYGDAEERDSLSNCEIFYQPAEDEVEEKSASDENLICILDLMEYEFMVNDIHINYNFPEGMCDYIRFSLPWHFNHEILPGPIVYEKKLPDGCNDEDEDDTNDCESTELCDRNDADNCVNTDSENGGSEEDLCPPSDGSEESPVRCCSGGAKLDKTEWKPNKQCFGGPSLIAEIEGGNKEFYESILEESPEGGLNGSITLPDLVSINGAEKRSNSTTGVTSVSSPFANYLKALDQAPDKLRRVKRADLPDFLQLSANYRYRPEPFFEFECLDRAGEVLHKILFMIREWNTYNEFKEFYDEGGNDSSDPDIEGLEGDDCDFEDRKVLDGESQACNDLLDLDDIAGCKGYAWCPIFNKGTKTYPRIKYKPDSESTVEE